MATKCFIGYGEALSHINVKNFKIFKQNGTDPLKMITEFGSADSMLHFLIRFYKKDGNNDVFYLPGRERIKSSGYLSPGPFSSGCRESIRAMYTKLYSISGCKSYEEYNNHVAIGFRFQHKNKQQINVRMKRAVKLLNTIEEHFGWETRTTLHKAAKKDLLLANEDNGVVDMIAQSDKTVEDPKFREYLERTTTFYLFRPATEWLLSSHTMSLFMLFLRLCGHNRYGNINTYQEFKNQTEKILAPYKNCVFLLATMSFTNFVTGETVGIKNKDDQYLLMAYKHLDALCANIKTIFNNEVTVSTADSVSGLKSLIDSVYKEKTINNKKSIGQNFATAIKEMEAKK